MENEFKRRDELGCLISLGVLALVAEAISCVKTKEITVVDFIFVPIIVAFLVYYIIAYKQEKDNEKQNHENDYGTRKRNLH